ncbi:MAG: helicase, partial [Deltaproteobacteria bacterium]|nr:helicase [Deltaproteobacteria bacterium]
MSDPARPAVTAVLGPTNTGKTHRALERLLEHPTGVIGLPLRLLAREVYDRLTARVGEQAVALVTGEERRVPRAPRYWVATVEAMPTSLPLDFVAVDEVQLMGDPERGHVFTDRVLRARGRRETALLGAGTAGPMLERLVPGIRTERHPRFSSLTYAGRSSLGGLPPRSAVVAFSADRVYELAARLSERRGGAAVVLGALSPRARNAQVALFQSGEVDYLVSTDAIGMGLNLDVHHVAFAGLTKFDGKEPRALHATELAQIAGRAGRHLRDGTFGTLGSLPELDPALVRAIETHRFEPLAQAYYRNAELDFSSAEALVASLRGRPPVPGLLPVARAEDLAVLLVLAGREAIRSKLRGPRDVERLWQVCQVPNYRGALVETHAELLAQLFDQLGGEPFVLSPEFLERSVRRIDDTRGDLSTLLDRMAAIRTFTYATHRPGWVDAAEEWQERTRAVEDRLSDALHAELVARFVPGRSRGVVLPPGAHHPFAALLARLESLGGARAEPPPPLVEQLVDAPHARFVLQSGGRIVAGATPVARLVRGRTLAEPEVAVTLEGAGSG